MKTIVHDYNEVEIISDAFKIEVKENDDSIYIQVLDFDTQRENSWNIIQTQSIEKKNQHSKDILTHLTEEIDN